jgi:peptidoglycan-associated lipoprotein
MRTTPWLALPLVLSIGCAHEQKKTETPPAQTAADKKTDDSKNATNAAAVGQCVVDSDCKASEICGQDKKCVAAPDPLADCSLIRVHFPFNSSDILGEDRPLLEKSAVCLRAHHELRVTIEGNADERGTEEYNLALGDQRAQAVAKYLRTLGVSEGQLKTVSYGKTQPVCQTHDEACWAKNRRAAVRPPMG